MWIHPSKAIIGEESKTLIGKSVVLGVTGSIACYRSIDLARKIMRRGAEVYPVLSSKASELISPTLFEWATGNIAIVEFSGEVGHIQYAENADSMIIAPATANTIAKIANGISDTSVTLTAIAMKGAKKPVGIVPVMHLHLYRSPRMIKNIRELEAQGYMILPPIVEDDKAKMPEVDDIAHFTEVLTLRGRDLTGLKILVTAGPTREYLDPVRFISNPSSGRMGVSIAKEAYFRGAKVTLIHGPITIDIPSWIKAIGITSTDELLNSVMKELSKGDYDVVIFAGAPIDFKFKEFYQHKIESSKGPITVELTLTPKVVHEVRRKYPELYIVGFAAETVSTDDELIDKAEEKLRRYGLNMIVANNVLRRDIGFSSLMNEVYIVDEHGRKLHIPKSRKEEIARIILDEIGKTLKSTGKNL